MADENAGKPARCPICHAITLVAEPAKADLFPVSTAPSPTKVENSPHVATTSTARWQLKTPEGHVYGPVPEGELERWIREGRVTAECELRQDEHAWQPADKHYPVLSAPRQPQAVVTAPTSYMRYRSDHRGVLVLVLGIIGWVSGCPVFSVVAWVMGSADLREMELGRMDPEGRAMTQAGRVLGMIYTLLWIGAMVLAAVFFVFIFAAS